MKVIVLGSGVIGVTTAYYLARAGHEVVVIDRQAAPAQETSFANAGEVSPGYSSPWAGPGVPVKAIKWLLMRHGPLVIWPKLDPVMWIWGLKMLRNCTEARYAVNKSRMIPIAEYSRDCLRALRDEIGIKYDERSRGTLPNRVHDVRVPIEPVAANRDEQIAVRKRARVDGEPGNLTILTLSDDPRPDETGNGSRRQRLRSSASRAISASSKANSVVPTICTFSCPLPTSSTRSPGSAFLIAN